MKTTEILDITKTLKLLYVEDDSMSRASSLGLFELFLQILPSVLMAKMGWKSLKVILLILLLVTSICLI